MTRGRRIWSAGGLAAVTLALLLPAPQAPAGVPACPDDRVVKRTSEAVLFLFKPPSARDYALAGCVLATGEITDLDQADSFRGAWDLRGTVAAWGYPVCSGRPRRCRTRVEVLDLGSLNTPPGRRRVLDAGLASAPKLGTVRVRTDMGVAWIACPRRTGTNPLSRAPECTRPGRARNAVFVAPAGAAEPRRVDRGRGIDPLSLRLDGRRLTWRHDGRRRTARL